VLQLPSGATTPIGDERDISGTLHTRYGFTGQREEDAIGLYFYNARWYDAELRRFVQADSIVPEPGNPQSLNRYSYGLNNPLRYTDPSGRAYQQMALVFPQKRDRSRMELYWATWGRWLASRRIRCRIVIVTVRDLHTRHGSFAHACVGQV